ncbi:hypothetical protein [Thermoactinomyces sp. DSM 45892]|uniref:hypothetical protein n=1 Tax=Thermoactinomyces sp. DSM 45892 TaxID=1882753 RepID=UPI000895B634|nr:hypothetical protein [Thermoactinomyces sp. DSM 45892]SDY85861.1 hypothetical protein SAMN05444416_10992 [Thermoactinomyces sp. DSM 45892]
MVSGIKRVVKELESEIQRLEGLKSGFDTEQSSFTFNGVIENCIIGRVIDGAMVYDHINQIDSKIQQKRAAIKALNDGLSKEVDYNS